MIRASARLAVAGALLAACGVGGSAGSGGEGGTGGVACAPGPTVGDLPCDVAMVLEAKCQPCHQIPEMNGAHFPLLTYEDTQKPLGSIRRWQRMSQVIAPDSIPHMPKPPAPQLNEAEMATLRAWFAACAPPQPEGEGCDTGE